MCMHLSAISLIGTAWHVKVLSLLGARLVSSASSKLLWCNVKKQDWIAKTVD